MTEHALPRKTLLRFCLGIAALCVLIYGSSLGNDFVYWDDPILILENPIIRGLTPYLIGKAFVTYDPELYVPLTTLSYQLNYIIAGIHPFIYHLTNLLLHMGSAMLTGWVAWLLSKNTRVAALTALLFAVHPIQVEAVAWAAARKDVLASFFFLLALGCFLTKRHAASLLTYLAGLVSKVSILVFPMIVLLLAWREKKLSKKSFIRALPFFLLSIIFGIVALFGKTQSSQHLWQKILMAGRATLWALYHHVVPVSYNVLYPYDTAISITNIDLLLPLFLVIALTIGAWMIRHRFREVTFGWFWFLLLLAPSFLTIEKGGDLIRDVYITSDRYAYLACIGIFFAFAALLDRYANRRIFLGVSIALVTVFAALAFVQTFAWRNTLTLFQKLLVTYPQSHVAWNNIGAYYDQLGEYDIAKEAYEKSVSFQETGHGWFNLGQIAMKENRPNDAIAAYLRAVELRPFHPVAQLNLGALLLDTGRSEEALTHLLEAQKFDPSNLTVYLNLGIALERLGNTVDARRAYERALQIDPENAYALQRIAVLSQ